MHLYIFIYNACFVGHISLPAQVLNVAVIVLSAPINDNIGEDIHALLLAYNIFFFPQKEDLRAVVDYLRADGDVSLIGLWGRSMGAVTRFYSCTFYTSVSFIQSRCSQFNACKPRSLILAMKGCQKCLFNVIDVKISPWMLECLI